MKTKKIIIIVGFIILIFSVSAFCQNKVSWYSFNMGYANPTGASTAVKSVVGQNYVGTTQQSNTEVISGFLADTLFRGTIVDIKNQERAGVGMNGKRLERCHHIGVCQRVH